MLLWGFPGTIIALGLVSFFTDVGSEMIFPLLPVFLSEQLHAGTTFLGMVEGAADAVASLLKLIAGYLADRWVHRKPLVLFGYGLAAMVRPLMGCATAPWHVLFIRLSDRVGKGIRSAPRDAFIADLALPGQAGKAFGLHRAMDHAGAVVGPLVAAGLLSLSIPLRTVFWSTVIPGAICLIILLSIKEPQRSVVSVSPSGAIDHDAATTLPLSLRRYLLILLFFSLGNSSDAFLLLRARDLGLSTAALPVLWTVLHLSKLSSSYGGGILSDKIPRAYLIMGGWVVYAGTYLGLALAHQVWQVWFLFLIYGLYYGMTEPAEKALVKDLAPSLARGKAFGYYNFMIGASALPASLFTGWLWNHWGPLAALGVGAGIAGTAAILLFVWKTNASPTIKTKINR